MMHMHTIRILFPHERFRYAQHLLRLDAGARRLRFARAIKDQGIGDYVASLDRIRHAILVHEDDTLAVVGAVLLTFRDRGLAELAFSVEPAWRRQGLATDLARRALLWARNRDIQRVGVYCLSENIGMRRLAQRLGLRVQIDGPDCEGTLALPPRTPFSLVQEMAAERAGLFACTARLGRNFRPLAPRWRRAA